MEEATTIRFKGLDIPEKPVHMCALWVKNAHPLEVAEAICPMEEKDDTLYTFTDAHGFFQSCSYSFTFNLNVNDDKNIRLLGMGQTFEDLTAMRHVIIQEQETAITDHDAKLLNFTPVNYVTNHERTWTRQANSVVMSAISRRKESGKFALRIDDTYMHYNYPVYSGANTLHLIRYFDHISVVDHEANKEKKFLCRGNPSSFRSSMTPLSNYAIQRESKIPYDFFYVKVNKTLRKLNSSNPMTTRKQFLIARNKTVKFPVHEVHDLLDDFLTNARTYINDRVFVDECKKTGAIAKKCARIMRKEGLVYRDKNKIVVMGNNDRFCFHWTNTSKNSFAYVNTPLRKTSNSNKDLLDPASRFKSQYGLNKTSFLSDQLSITHISGYQSRSSVPLALVDLIALMNLEVPHPYKKGECVAFHRGHTIKRPKDITKALKLALEYSDLYDRGGNQSIAEHKKKREALTAHVRPLVDKYPFQTAFNKNLKEYFDLVDSKRSTEKDMKNKAYYFKHTKFRDLPTRTGKGALEAIATLPYLNNMMNKGGYPKETKQIVEILARYHGVKYNYETPSIFK